MSVARDLRYLAAWADYASSWLDDTADAGSAAGERLMVSFDAADFAVFDRPAPSAAIDRTYGGRNGPPARPLR